MEDSRSSSHSGTRHPWQRGQVIFSCVCIRIPISTQSSHTAHSPTRGQRGGQSGSLGFPPGDNGGIVTAGIGSRDAHKSLLPKSPPLSPVRPDLGPSRWLARGSPPPLPMAYLSDAAARIVYRPSVAAPRRRFPTPSAPNTARTSTLHFSTLQSWCPPLVACPFYHHCYPIPARVAPMTHHI